MCLNETELISLIVKEIVENTANTNLLLQWLNALGPYFITIVGACFAYNYKDSKLDLNVCKGCIDIQYDETVQRTTNSISTELVNNDTIIRDSYSDDYILRRDRFSASRNTRRRSMPIKGKTTRNLSLLYDEYDEDSRVGEIYIYDDNISHFNESDTNIPSGVV